MNRRVLLVGASADVLVALRRALEEDCEVQAALSELEALGLLEERGPFTAVVTDLETERAIGLLAEVREQWPDTGRVLVLDGPDFAAARRAVEEAGVLRLLEKPLERATVREAVEAAGERFRRRSGERLQTDQLQFARETLLQLTESLAGRLSRHHDLLREIQDLSLDLNRAADLQEVAMVAAVRSARILGGRSVHVALRDPGGEEVRFAAGPPLSARTLAQNLACHDGPVGLLRVDERGPDGRALSDDERRVLSSLGAAIATASRNQTNRRQREDAQHATIFALARLAEERDDETGQHLERVSEYCRLIALGLREDGHFRQVLTDAWIDDLVDSAPLHDIGKVGIPDAILMKRGSLDEDEWRIMRTHPAIGAETLRQVLESSGEQGFLRMGHEIAWCHHERWNGAGYPRGIAGEDIPLSARIVAVADCYDALTTERPYKAAWEHGRSIAWIEEQAGEHFDPRIVEAFLRRAAAADEIRGRLADAVPAEYPPSRAA